MQRVAAVAALLCLPTVPVPSVAQATTTAPDVYEPTILSAAHNVTGLPGGNSVCGSLRVRKPWHALTAAEQALYLEATQRAIATGGVASFAAIAADPLSQAQGEYSCAFFSWHRRLGLAYESYLRDLDARFACLTVPYYDVHTAYVQSAMGECTNMFECSGIFQAIGGASHASVPTTVVLDSGNATGYLVNGAPYHLPCNDNDNDNNDDINDDDDGNNCRYIVRNDLSRKVVPSAASFSAFQHAVATSVDYATFLKHIKYGVHTEVLDAIGGLLSTAAAARDVLYYSWYASLDMYLHVYHLCRIGVPLTYPQIIASPETFAKANQTCGGVDGVEATSPLLMPIAVNGSVLDAAQHPTLGRYFASVGTDSWHYADIQQLGDYAYTYHLPEVVRQQLLSNIDMCPGFNRAFAASYPALNNATAVSGTRPTTRKVTTTTTTTTTTRRVGGPSTTRTNVTTVTARANATSSSSSSASSSSSFQSTLARGQVPSRYGAYSYLGNFGTDNVAVGEGPVVTNGYAGYTPFYSRGALTTKHNGMLRTPFSALGTGPSPTRRDVARTRNVVAHVTVGAHVVPRNVTVSVATSGTYWAWHHTAYQGLFTRFRGNTDLVATHMLLLECHTFDTVRGLSNLSSTFVTRQHLVTNRVACGQRLDLVRAGLLPMAVRATSYAASSVHFARTSVIQAIVSSYRRSTHRNGSYIRQSYRTRVSARLRATQRVLANQTRASTHGPAFSSVSDRAHRASNMTSTIMPSRGNTTSSATTGSSTWTTTTTARKGADALDETSIHTTDTTGARGTMPTTGTTASTTGSSAPETMAPLLETGAQVTTSNDKGTTPFDATWTTASAGQYVPVTGLDTAGTSLNSASTTWPPRASGQPPHSTALNGTATSQDSDMTTAPGQDGQAAVSTHETTTFGPTPRVTYVHDPVPTTANATSTTGISGQSVAHTGQNPTYTEPKTAWTNPHSGTMSTTPSAARSTETSTTVATGLDGRSGITTPDIDSMVPINDARDTLRPTYSQGAHATTNNVTSTSPTPGFAMPDATSAPTGPKAPTGPMITPAPTMPSATATTLDISVTPASTGPSVTPSPTGPSATPASTGPSATPASTEPSVTPAPTLPAALTGPNVTLSPTKPNASTRPTPAPTRPNVTTMPEAASTVPNGPTMPDAASTVPNGPMKPSVTPAPTMPTATPAPTEPGVTPAPTMASTPPTSMEPMMPNTPPTDEPTSCTSVSVKHDATFCIQGPICRGSGDAPSGSLCPKMGDRSVQDCRKSLASYLSSNTCVAPVDAVCAKVETGAWGCTFEAKPRAPTGALQRSKMPTTQSSMLTPPANMASAGAPTPCPTTEARNTPMSPFVNPMSNRSTARSMPKSLVAPTTSTGAVWTSGATHDVSLEEPSQHKGDDVSTAVPTSFATTSIEDSSTGSQTGVSGAGLAGILAGVCAAVAVAGFTAYRVRPRRHDGAASPSVYFSQQDAL